MHPLVGESSRRAGKCVGGPRLVTNACVETTTRSAAMRDSYLFARIESWSPGAE